MYVILVNNNNELYASHKERIMQRSKLVDNLCFLVNPVYKGYNMANFTVLLEYVLPCSKKYRSEILILSNEMYEDHLKYCLPLDTDLTSEAGKIEVQLTFALADLDEKGNAIQRIRKTSTTTIDIVPISAWSDIIPDSALSPIDQRIIKQDAQIKALADLANALEDTKADDIKYDKKNNTLQLLSGNKEIGNIVTLKDCEEVVKDGVPVVDFNFNTSEDKDKNEENDNVVEF